MINYWQRGHDLVQGKRSDLHGQPFSMKLIRLIGYKVMDIVSKGIVVPGASDFRLVSGGLLKYLLELDERELLLRGLVMLGSKNPKIFEYRVGQRRYGKSSYNFKMLLGILTKGFVSFSTVPIKSAFVIGLVTFILAGLYLGVDIFNALITGKQIIEGWKTVVILIFIVNGIQILYLGILGEYLGVIFKETKRRPLSVIEKTINLK